MTKWNRTKEFMALQKAAYQALRDSGFVDIEGGVDGHLLQQPTVTVSLSSAAKRLGGRLGRAKSVIGNSEEEDPKKHEKWLDQALIDKIDSGKEAYYEAAQILSTLVFRTKSINELKYSRSLHSDGYGENVIADELSIPRVRVRRYLAILKNKIKIFLDIHP